MVYNMLRFWAELEVQQQCAARRAREGPNTGVTLSIPSRLGPQQCFAMPLYASERDSLRGRVAAALLEFPCQRGAD